MLTKKEYLNRFQEIQEQGERRFFRQVLEDADDEMPIESGA